MNKVETQRGKESIQPRLELWRAITGRYNLQMDVFEGVEDPSKEGIFTSNYSYDQYRGGGPMVMDDSFSIGGAQLIMNRRVSGLPVFFNRSEGISWLSGKKYEYPPVLAKLEVPLSLLVGSEARLKIVRNAAFSEHERILEESELREIVADKNSGGEAYLATLAGGSISPDLLRRYETLYVLALKEDGSVFNDLW